MCSTTCACAPSSSARLARVSSTCEFWNTVLTNCAITRVVSTLSSSKAFGVPDMTARIPSTRPSR